MTKFDLYFLKFLIHSTNNDTYQGMQTLRKLFCICQRQCDEKGFKTFNWDFNQIVEFKSSSSHAIFKLECSKYKGRYYHRNNVLRIEYIYGSNLSLNVTVKVISWKTSTAVQINVNLTNYFGHVHEKQTSSFLNAHYQDIWLDNPLIQWKDNQQDILNELPEKRHAILVH